MNASTNDGLTRVIGDAIEAKSTRSILLDTDADLSEWIAAVRHHVSQAHMLEEAERPQAARERFAKIAGIALAAMQAIDGTLGGV